MTLAVEARIDRPPQARSDARDTAAAGASSRAITALSPRTFHARLIGDRRTGGRRLRPGPLLLACLAQLLLVLLALSSNVARRSEPPAIEAISLPHVTEPARPLAPRTPLPAPAKLTPILLPPPPVRIADPAKREPPTAPVPPPALPAPVQPITTSITLPPAPPPDSTGKVADAYKSAVRAAVFGAYRVPASARLMDEYGETQIGFVLLDGVVTRVRTLVSSGHPSLDRAALAAVSGASYPPTPAPLRGHALEFQITLYNRRGG